MNISEFDAELKREGYRVINTSLRPNLLTSNHTHDFDAKSLVLGGDITITCNNTPVTYRAGQCYAVPCGTQHVEHVGPEGVALLSGRRRTGPITREAFESDLKREGYEVINTGQRPGFAEELHAHDFDVRIMILGGEVTICRDGATTTFKPGDCCEILAGCMHTLTVGAEGVAYLVGKATRRA